MITLKIGRDNFWFLQASHTWHGDNRRVVAELQKTLPPRWGGIHAGVPYKDEIILSRALARYPLAREVTTEST